MTKADIVNEVSKNTGIEKGERFPNRRKKCVSSRFR